MTRTERDARILQLLEEVSPMLHNLARWVGSDFDDLYQEASIAILTLVERIPDAPVSFAVQKVRFDTIGRLQYWRRRQHASLDAPLDSETGVTLADLLPDPHRVDPLVMVLAQERLQELAEQFTTRPVRPLTKGQIGRCQEWHETALAEVSYV